jgi:capsular polysaccharide transport system permease protein
MQTQKAAMSVQKEIRQNRKEPRRGLVADDLDDDEDLPEERGGTSPRAAIRPVAGPTKFRRRHLVVILSFLLCVAAPLSALGWYLYSVAADQFASTVAFNVRADEGNAPAADLLGFQVSGGNTATDAEILNAYIASQQLVEHVDATLDLSAIFSKPANDPLFSYNPEGTIEDLLSYWNRMVKVSFEADKGLIAVRVLAFSALEAQRIAQEILDQSSRTINQLSSVAQEDATRYARAELDRALERLKVARQALTRYRSENQIVDPEAVVAAQMGLLNSLQQQLADTLIEFDLLADVTRTNDPRIEQSQRKIDVIEARISQERRKLGTTDESSTGSARAVTEIVGRFEELRVDLEFAQQTYLNALAGFDSALEKARRKSRYLAAYVEPTLAQRAEYPQRAIILSLTALFLFLVWSILALVLYSIRDRR